LPTHKSAAKRMKTAERDRRKNRVLKTRLRAAVKTFKSRKGSEKKEDEFKEVVSLLDRAAGKGVIHKNKAARDKSRLSKHLKNN
jgi:small subunit ribosomal protein S20